MAPRSPIPESGSRCRAIRLRPAWGTEIVWFLVRSADPRVRSPRPALVRRSPPSGEGGCGERSAPGWAPGEGDSPRAELAEKKGPSPQPSPREERGEGERFVTANGVTLARPARIPASLRR